MNDKGTTQTYYKENNQWYQISSKNITRPCSAEQLLSHLLPAIRREDLTVKVELKKVH